jgi:hypothetical protein
MLPLFTSLPAPARGLEDDRRSGCVSPHYELVQGCQNASYHNRRVPAWENPEILLKRYSIFTLLLRLLYDFSPPLCHTPYVKAGAA